MANRITVRRRGRLVIGASLVATGLLLVLAGCSAQDHISAKLDDGTLTFVSCYEYSANGITVAAASLNAKSRNYKDMWKAAGSGKFGPKTPVELGSPPAGFRTTLGPHAFNFRQVEIDFALNRDSRPGSLGTARYDQFDGSKLVDGRWLRWDGTVADSPW
jgi:hypothetical protein